MKNLLIWIEHSTFTKKVALRFPTKKLMVDNSTQQSKVSPKINQNNL